MEFLNRSAISVSPKQPFVDWANALTPEFPMEIDVPGTTHTYLTDPDFEDTDKQIKKYYKQIFEEELGGIWTDENDWPQKRNFKTFCEWFHFEISNWVQDLSRKDLFGEF